MLEALELERVAAGIEEEHGRLFSRLSRIADSGLENEGNPRGSDAIGQGRKRVPLQQRPEMWHGHLNALDLPGILGRQHRPGGVRRDLVAEEIEVDPGVGAASLGAAEDIAVEPAGRGEIPNEECIMEWLRHTWRALSGWRDSFAGRPRRHP